MTLDEQLIDAALTAGREAAALHRAEEGRLAPARWSEKGTADFVTEVDREAERLIVGQLRRRFPHHEFLAEEGTEDEETTDQQGADGAERADATPIRWIIDPLDGTTNWLHGYPEYAVSIAALDPEGLRAAVVVNSATGEEFDAVRGGGSRLGGRPIEVSGLADLRLALIGTGFPFKRTQLLPAYLRSLDAVLRATSGVRRAGAAALDLCALARGRLDGFWELWLMPWDVAAGALIVREAGGHFGPLGLTGEVADALGVVIAEGARFRDLAAGRPQARPVAGGAFLAGNRHLTEPLQKLVTEALSEPA